MCGVICMGGGKYIACVGSVTPIMAVLSHSVLIGLQP